MLKNTESTNTPPHQGLTHTHNNIHTITHRMTDTHTNRLTNSIGQMELSKVESLMSGGLDRKGSEFQLLLLGTEDIRE